MNIEFHYYMLHYLLRAAGFPDDESHVIAYASQFVDYNVVSYRVDTARASYETLPTQDWGFWNPDTPRRIYVPFHFFPGDEEHEGARRLDGKSNPRNCTPDSPGAKALLIAALKTRDPYRVGIALHTYADTWAHQNFTGVREDWNLVDANSMIPAVGHAQVLKVPDQLAATWTDPRLVPDRQTIRNAPRFFAAARKVYRYLATYNRRSFEDADLVLEMLAARLDLKRERTMEERILDLCIDEHIGKFDRTEWISDAIDTDEIPDDYDAERGYDKLMWLKDQVLYRSKLMRKKAVPAKGDFFSSHFYRFNEAAKAHLEEADRILAQSLHLTV